MNNDKKKKCDKCGKTPTYTCDDGDYCKDCLKKALEPKCETCDDSAWTPIKGYKIIGWTLWKTIWEGKPNLSGWDNPKHREVVDHFTTQKEANEKELELRQRKIPNISFCVLPLQAKCPDCPKPESELAYGNTKCLICGKSTILPSKHICNPTYQDLQAKLEAAEKEIKELKEADATHLSAYNGLKQRSQQQAEEIVFLKAKLEAKKCKDPNCEEGRE